MHCTVSQKPCHYYTFVHNLDDCWSIWSVHSGSQKAASTDHISSHASKFIAMRLCALHKDGNKVLDRELWPIGVTVRPWIYECCRVGRTEVAATLECTYYCSLMAHYYKPRFSHAVHYRPTL